MNLPLRVTYQNADIVFYILNEKPSVINQDIAISLGGHTYQLHKSSGKWATKGEATVGDHNLISAIGNSIALRYRI